MPNRTRMESLPETYEALATHVDAVFARTRASFAGALACRAGCSACCRVHLRLLPVEAERLRAALGGLAPAVRGRVRTQAQRFDPRAPVCPLLVDGVCAVYDHRPLVCRAQGLPLRFEREVEVCDLNFAGATPPQEAVLDGGAINDQLVAVDFFARRIRGGGSGAPISVVDLAAGPTD